MLNSPTLFPKLRQLGHVPRVYATADPQVKEKRLDGFVAKAGGAPALLVQTDNGQVVLSIPAPKTEADVLSVISKLQGGN